MAYDFPDNPSNGDIVQTANKRFQYNTTLTRWEYKGEALLNVGFGVIVPGTNTWVDSDTTLTATGCVEMSLDNATWSQNITVVNGATFYTRWEPGVTCDGAPHGTTITGRITDYTAGAYQDYSKTIDKVPDAFVFSPASATVTPLTVTPTTSFTITGINSPTFLWGALTTDSAGVAPSNAQYSMDGVTYAAIPAAPGTVTVEAGDTIYVRFTTGNTAPTNDLLSLNIGESVTAKETGTYAVTVAKASFSPTAPTAPTVADGVTTACITWDAGADTIYSTGCLEFSVNGGAFTQANTAIANGNTLCTRWKDGTGPGTTCADALCGVVLTGTVESVTKKSGTFSLTVDRQPNSFTFSDQTGAAISTVVTSNTVTLGGMNAEGYLQATAGTNALTSIKASINGGAYAAIPATGTYTRAVKSGDTVQLQATTGASSSTAYSVIVSVGDSVCSQNNTWTVTTAAPVPTVTAPTITSPSDGATAISTTPTITTSAYAPLNGAGAHNCTDWELYKDAYPLTSTATVSGRGTGTNGTTGATQYKTTGTADSPSATFQDQVNGAEATAAGDDANHPMFQWASALSINGYTDWYIPAKNELEILYRNLKPTTTANVTTSGANANGITGQTSNYTAGSPAQTTVAIFQSGGSQAFSTANDYWSASEDSGTTVNAWRQGFSSGNQAISSKNVSLKYARAVRRIPIADYTAAGSPAIGSYLAGGFYGGKISATGNGTADYALIVAPKVGGEYQSPAGTNPFLSISAADADGFEVGWVIKGNTSGALGVISAINGTTVTYVSISGTFQTGETISTDSSSYTSVISVTCDTTKKTSYPITSSLGYSTTHYVRAQHKSADPIASGWSAWSEFTTVGLQIGDEFGGGYYAGQIKVSGTIYNLVLAPRTSGSLQGQYGGNSASTIQWKTSHSGPDTNAGGMEYGATAMLANSTADWPMFNWCRSSATGPNAGTYDATNALGTGIGGYNDWYIPAKNELEILYRNLKPTTEANDTASGANANAVPSATGNYTAGSPVQITSVPNATLFKSGGSQAFSTGVYYWSASEDLGTIGYSWRQLFSGGNQNIGGKPSTNGSARAVRRVAA